MGEIPGNSLTLNLELARQEGPDGGHRICKGTGLPEDYQSSRNGSWTGERMTEKDEDA